MRARIAWESCLLSASATTDVFRKPSELELISVLRPEGYNASLGPSLLENPYTNLTNHCNNAHVNRPHSLLLQVFGLGHGVAVFSNHLDLAMLALQEL